jgi:hypothetical protein
MTTNLFSPLSFVAVFGSGIRDPGWVKLRIRNTGFKPLLWVRNGFYADPYPAFFLKCGSGSRVLMPKNFEKNVHLSK